MSDHLIAPVTGCYKEFCEEYGKMMERRYVRHLEYMDAVFKWLFAVSGEV